MTFYTRYGKRAFDLAFASCALVMLSPVLLLLTGLVALKLGRPVLFRQLRTGQERQPFAVLKFRSMLNAVDGEGQALPDEVRLTPFGDALRSTSLDELPSLLNILRGEMSLVGPRPLLPSYDTLYSAEQARRLEVPPGITGWAQVNGRNAIGWAEKLALDRWYVENRSFMLDLRILWMTVNKVFARRDINDVNGAPVSLFKGETKLPSGFDPSRKR